MIRIANTKDIEAIMIIIKEAQREMEETNNPQWNEENDYPSRNKMLSDIKNKDLYVYEETVIKGFMAITRDKEEYQGLVETTSYSAYILHRLAIKKEYRKEGIATKLFKYAEEMAKKNKVSLLKADTEIHNNKMNNLFKKLGFIKKGEFEYDDYPGHYIYYEKEMK